MIVYYEKRTNPKALQWHPPSQFRDNHDLADYWDLPSEAYFEVDIQRRLFLTALEPQLAKRLTEITRTQIKP